MRPGSAVFPRSPRGAAPELLQKGNGSWEARSIPLPFPWRCHQPAQARVLLLGKQSLRVTFRPSRALAGGTLPGMRFVPGPLLHVLRPPRASPGRYCSPCMGKTRLLEDCDYPSLNRTSTPQAVFKTEPWSFPQLPCQWKPQERQICFFQCNF